jgi:hypothetical protein
VLQIAITAELVRIGMTPASAAKAAIPFTDLGYGGSGWAGDPDSRDTRGVREPGELLQDAPGTLLAVTAGDDGPFARVMPADQNEVFAEVFRRAPVAFLHLDPIVYRVRRALGADK